MTNTHVHELLPKEGGGIYCTHLSCDFEMSEQDILDYFLAKSKEENESRKALDMHEPIHAWFELSYAQYLTIPRSVLQSMPVKWQQKFVDLLVELDDTIDWRPNEGRYWVRLKDGQGRFVHDELMDYQRGRRRVSSRKDQS